MNGLIIALVTACLLDFALGDPPNRLHPVAAMGKIIQALANAFNGRTSSGQFWHGVLVVLAGGVLFALPCFWITRWLGQIPFWPRWILVGILLKPVFAFRRLVEAGAAIEQALLQSDLNEARRLVSFHLVSRDTTGLSEGYICSAVVESLAENLTDSFLAPLFFFIFFGLPAAWFYRYVNTADAMIGYHTERYEYLGKFAARLDDFLNWLPARIAALGLVVAAGLRGLNARAPWQIMREQHVRTSSPNAGWTMAAAAGALGVCLEKQGCYQLNESQPLPDVAGIDTVNQLVSTAALLALVLLAGMAVAGKYVLQWIK